MQASEKTARSRLDKVVAMLPESLAGERKRTGALVASAVQQAMGAAIGIIQGGGVREMLSGGAATVGDVKIPGLRLQE